MQVNEAMVVDAGIAMIEEICARPGSMMNDRFDAKDELSLWHECAPLKVKDVVIDPFGADVVIGAGGHDCTLHMEAMPRRSKGHYMERSEYGTAMTPNAVKMVRVLRWINRGTEAKRGGRGGLGYNRERRLRKKLSGFLG